MSESPENPIDRFFTTEAGKVSKFSELFRGNDDFIDQMSELSQVQIQLVNALDYTDGFLRELEIPPLFSPLTHKFMRLQVSKDRKSRGEYVEVNKAEEQREREGAGQKLI